MDVSDAHDAVVLLDEDSALLHLGDDKFLERVQSYLELSRPCASASPTSITWISGSIRGFTSGPPSSAAATAVPGASEHEGTYTQRTLPGWTGRRHFKITALVGEAGDEGELDIIGIGLAIRKGSGAAWS